MDGPGNDAVTRHLDWMRQRGLSQVTIYRRRLILRRLRRDTRLAPLEISATVLANWRARLDVTDASAANYISHLRAFYAWCVGAGLRADDPAAGLPVPALRRRLPHPISEEDLILALDSAPERIRLWLVLAAWCGLRAKEIALLRIEDLHLTAGRPHLEVTRRAGKGGRERIVPLSPFVLAEIKAAGLPLRGWAFRRMDGRPGPNAPYIVSKLCNRHLHSLGITATLHWGRHRCGSMAYQGTKDLRAVQELLGHASPHTTAGYAAISGDATIAAVLALPVPGTRRRRQRALPAAS